MMRHKKGIKIRLKNEREHIFLLTNGAWSFGLSLEQYQKSEILFSHHDTLLIPASHNLSTKKASVPRLKNIIISFFICLELSHFSPKRRLPACLPLPPFPTSCLELDKPSPSKPGILSDHHHHHHHHHTPKSHHPNTSHRTPITSPPGQLNCRATHPQPSTLHPSLPPTYWSQFTLARESSISNQTLLISMNVSKLINLIEFPFFLPLPSETKRTKKQQSATSISQITHTILGNVMLCVRVDSCVIPHPPPAPITITITTTIPSCQSNIHSLTRNSKVRLSIPSH
ncbi:hypothetical protein QBC40DRAFT_288191 [Triangularia verruculosa]|uniref:Uncharacterized protein n=1 Tax=Triangularia verruculosa TaxID=2587418 RepID=A0AAN7ASF5_9PEZI|nr:hypothetical protein QBC40DRAFT_288191 [Triangularia verruculosa]